MTSVRLLSGKPSRHQSKPRAGARCHPRHRLAPLLDRGSGSRPYPSATHRDGADAPTGRAAQCRGRLAECCPRRPPRASAPINRASRRRTSPGATRHAIEELDQRAAKLFILERRGIDVGVEPEQEPLETGWAYRAIVIESMRHRRPCGTSDHLRAPSGTRQGPPSRVPTGRC